MVAITVMMVMIIIMIIYIHLSHHKVIGLQRRQFKSQVLRTTSPVKLQFKNPNKEKIRTRLPSNGRQTTHKQETQTHFVARDPVTLTQ